MKKKPIRIIHYRKQKIPVFIDDNGQSYYFKWHKCEYSCGAFNPDYEGEIINTVDYILNQTRYVDIEQGPSGKVYNLFGIWYLDYLRYHQIPLTSLNDKLLQSDVDVLAKHYMHQIFVQEKQKEL